MGERIIICDGMAMVTEPATTPDCEPHEPEPSGYVARAEWAARMLRTGRRCRRCKGCGLYLIWTPKGRPSKPQGSDGRPSFCASREIAVPDHRDCPGVAAGPAVVQRAVRCLPVQRRVR